MMVIKDLYFGIQMAMNLYILVDVLTGDKVGFVLCVGNKGPGFDIQLAINSCILLAGNKGI